MVEKDPGEFYLQMKDMHIKPSSRRPAAAPCSPPSDDETTKTVVTQPIYPHPLQILDINTLKPPNQSQISPPNSIEERRVREFARQADADTNAFYESIVALEKKTGSYPVFLQRLAKYPRARELYVHLQLELNNPSALPTLYHYAAQDQKAAGNLVAYLALQEPDVQDQLQGLALASKMYNTSSGEASHETSWLASELEIQMKLLQTQERLEAETKQHGCFVHRSLADTIGNLIALVPEAPDTYFPLALDVATTFQFPPEQFWWTILKRLGQMREYTMLVELAMCSRPPLEMGYLAILQVLVTAEENDLARQLFRVIQDPVERDLATKLLIHR